MQALMSPLQCSAFCPSPRASVIFVRLLLPFVRTRSVRLGQRVQSYGGEKNWIGEIPTRHVMTEAVWRTEAHPPRLTTGQQRVTRCRKGETLMLLHLLLLYSFVIYCKGTIRNLYNTQQHTLPRLPMFPHYYCGHALDPLITWIISLQLGKKHLPHLITPRRLRYTELRTSFHHSEEA
ncbi:hypothetical protein O3P69_010091 [Scylla paramamosain]|uniref:Uncharacterized protein n=1 Tax=Scylla paramamosain TaxID=85552 RepID=A0AAW0SNF1_SCYPA